MYLHVYMTTISIKLANDNGNMVLFNGWYKLGRRLNTAVYMNQNHRRDLIDRDVSVVLAAPPLSQAI